MHLTDVLPAPLLFSLYALVGVVIIFLIAQFFRYQIIFSAILQAKASAQQHLLNKYGTNKRFAAKLREGLERTYHQTQRDEIRGGAFKALLALARMNDEGHAEQMLNRALQDESLSIRRIAITEFGRKTDETTADLLEAHLGLEQDPDLWRISLAGVLRCRWRQLTQLIRDENFDKAEALIRQLLVLAPEDQALKALQDRMPLIRQKSFAQQQAKEQIKRLAADEETHRTAAQLAKQAAKAIAKNDCDTAEEMAKKALGEFPQNELAKNILRDLPQLRRDLNEAATARENSRRQTQAAERRQEVERLLKDQEYEAASEALLELRTLDPGDAWTCQNLENLPNLQEQKRRLENQENLTKRSQRVRELRRDADEKWLRKEFAAAEKPTRELIALESDEPSHKALLTSILEARRIELADELYSQVQQAIRAGKFDLADEKLREVLLTQPEGARVKSLYDQLAALRQMHSDAKSRRLKARRQHLTEGWKRKAHAFLKAGKLEEARNAANKFAANSTDSAAIAVIIEQIEGAFRRMFTNKILNEVSESLEEGQLDEGERKLRSLIPYEDSPTRIEDAMKSFALLRAQQAEAKQREVESQIKEEAGRMRKNVMSFMREAEFDKAESELRAILAAVPDEGLQRLLTDMPEVRRKHQASTEAANEVESLAKAQKSLEKAQELFATGRFDESAKLLRKTIALDPSNDRAAKLLRRAHEFDSLGTSPSAPKTKFDPYGQIIN